MNLKASYKHLRNGIKLELAILNSKLSCLPPGVPHSLFLCLTYRCQLRCSHCRYLQPSYKNARGNDMPLELASLILRTAAGAGIPRVIMFGGEPALYGNLEKVVKEASTLGLFTEMDTNGLKLDGKKLASLAAAGLSALRISLHSASAAEHNGLQNSRSFPLVKDTIKRALKSGFLVYLSSCLSGKNSGAESIVKLSSLGRGWGAHGIRFLAHISDTRSAGTVSSQIASSIRERGLEGYARTCFETFEAQKCVAQEGKTIFVSPEGTVRACPYSVKVLGRVENGFPLSTRIHRTLPCLRQKGLSS